LLRVLRVKNPKVGQAVYAAVARTHEPLLSTSKSTWA
jgi:hypothetical protein